jgi:hypothetical protein
VFLGIAFAGFFNMMLQEPMYFYIGLGVFAAMCGWLVLSKRQAVSASG